MKRPRVLFADDHPFTLEGLRAFLDPHVRTIGTATDGRMLIEKALDLQPDLIVLDIAMPGVNGIEAAVQIKKSLPEVKFLFVTMHAKPAYLEAALSAGASGYIIKTAAREELLDAIKSVLSGRVYVSRGLSTEDFGRFQTSAEAATAMHLSPREREILQMISEGRLAKEIAFSLGISVKTVAFHRQNIKRKLGLRTTAELTRHVVQKELF